MNKLFLIGRLTKDPEFRTTTSGKDVAVLNVAVNEKYGEKTNTTYFRVSVWGNLSKVCKYLSKGKKCAVIGRVGLHLYDNNGKPGGSLEVTAESIELLSPKDSVDENGFTEITDADLPF